MIVNDGDVQRVLVVHGETPSRFSDKSDRSVSLLFGDAGSAAALEAVNPNDSENWFFNLHTDGSKYVDMFIEGGGYRNRLNKDPINHCVKMNVANIFNFIIRHFPFVIQDA